jgi:predicted transcriptional regulator
MRRRTTRKNSAAEKPATEVVAQVQPPIPRPEKNALEKVIAGEKVSKEEIDAAISELEKSVAAATLAS